MSTEISVDMAVDIVVDIAVDSRSILGRQSVDTRSTVGRYSVDSPTNTWTTELFMKSWIPWYRTKPGYFTSAPFLFLTGFWNIWAIPDVVWIESVDSRCWFVSDKSSSKFCRSTLLICVWQIKFFNTKQFQYCWIAFQLKEIGKLMCYKILNDKNTHLIAWNEILTQFGECDSLPNPVCAVAEPGAHAEN